MGILIFHIGMGAVPAISRELAKLGPYRFLDWTTYMELGQGAKELLNRDILKFSSELKPAITFLHIQRPGVISPEIAAQLKGVVINYTYDVSLPVPEWYYDVGANISTTIFSSEKEVWDLKAKGIESQFQHVGYDNLVFRTDGSRGEYGDIVFLGNNYTADQNFELTDMRLDMVNFLKDKYGDQFKVYGNKWPYNDGNLMYRELKEAECFRSCKIAINISHFDLERYTSDRMFRIMGSGAFCLTKWYPGIEKDFIDGEHLRVWKDFDELKTLIDYYLTHEEERNKIAQAGNKYVSEHLTWEIRIKNIIDMARARLSKEYKSRVVKVQQQNYYKDPRDGTQMNMPLNMEEAPNVVDPDQEETYFQQKDIVEPVHTIEFLSEIPILQTPTGVNPPEYLKLYGERRIDYERLRNTCFFQLNNKNEVDVSVIIPVRSRTNFNKVLVRHLKAAMAAFPEVTYAITFVEYSVEMEHRALCTEDVNYINIPFGGYFNKCLSFNVGAMFSNKAKYYLFHDLDIVMDKKFFTNIFENLKRSGNVALQTFRLRRVLYCNENLSKTIISGQVPIEQLHTRYPGITEPNLPEQMRAPGGSIFVSRDQFVQAGGYDPELFFGYSIEDQFFYDKLSLTGGIGSCNTPGIEVYHLYHPPLWSSNPFLTHHHSIYQEFSGKPLSEKKAFFELERGNIAKFVK